MNFWLFASSFLCSHSWKCAQSPANINFKWKGVRESQRRVQLTLIQLFFSVPRCESHRLHFLQSFQASTARWCTVTLLDPLFVVRLKVFLIILDDCMRRVFFHDLRFFFTVDCELQLELTFFLLVFTGKTFIPAQIQLSCRWSAIFAFCCLSFPQSNHKSIWIAKQLVFAHEKVFNRSFLTFD